MKISKFLAVLALVTSTATFAQTVDGYLGAASNNMYRGETLSDNKAYVNAGVGVSIPVSKATVRGAVDVTSITGGFTVDTSVTLSLPVYTVAVYTSLISHGTLVDNFRNRENINEVVGGIRAPLFGGNVFGEYSREPITGDIKTDYLKVGYSRSVFDPKLTLGTSVLYSKDVGNLTPSHSKKFEQKSVELFAKYDFTSNLNGTVTAIRSKDDIFATKATQKYFAGVNYTF